MTEKHYPLSEFLLLTQEIYYQANTVHSKMEDNDNEHLEAIQVLFDKRQQAIEQMESHIQQPTFEWTTEDKLVILQLQEVEQVLQPLMNSLHQSFLSQMNRITQTKQVSTKYMGAYQNMATEGSFIDKRK
jgi:cobalamin biosynthesis protein CbiD